MALNHEKPDRCPLQAGFTPEFAARLQQDQGIHSLKTHNPHGGGNTYEIERLIGEDMLLTFENKPIRKLSHRFGCLKISV